MANINIVDASRLFGKGPSEMAKKKWIKSAIAHPGALREKLHVKEGENIPEEKLREAARSKDPTTRRQANLAMTLKGLRHGGEKKPARRSASEARRAMYGEK